MVRGGHLDITVLGALQVSEKGDLANWSIDPAGKLGNIGGAMDMPVGIKKVIVAMEHTTRHDQLKILRRCTLPLTCPRCVDLIITDVAVIDVTPRGLVLKEVAPGWTVEEVQSLTEPILIPSDDLKEMEL
jgi:3-oxoacid CoA-transferase subunit B